MHYFTYNLPRLLKLHSLSAKIYELDFVYDVFIGFLIHDSVLLQVVGYATAHPNS